MNAPEPNRPVSAAELERRLRAALADTHLETPRPIATLEMPLLDKLMPAAMRASLRPAAVLVPMIRRGSELHVLLTVRAPNLRAHGGQIAFPGGAKDASDITAVDNALREAQEEVGLDPASVEIVGYLDDFPTLSRFLVTPVVGIVDPEPMLSLQQDEVAEVFDVPFSVLAEPANFERKLFERAGFEVPIYEVNWQGRRIWGATAGMLWDLAGRMRR
ncbi:CoA pyrophosphatase [Solimonas variicoloris]|uniref:CoA pyrophosphatase n=1 Tax=Solimonas variicoloris TaxID=254408 RepID=UPI0003634AC0|nr:CoA pyrophosphatase [Solimonas variicoloris]